MVSAAATRATTRTFQDALDEALSALRTANPEHALVVCDELLSANAYPNAVRALRLRGQAQEAMGDVMRATQDYERVLDICPTDTPTMLSYAKALSKLGRKEEAAVIAHHLLDWLPNDPDAQRIASEGIAVQAYDAPQNNGRLAAAQAQFAVGRISLALNTVRKAVMDSPDRADARLLMTVLLWRDGQLIQSAENCQLLLDEQPDCLLAHAMLAHIWRSTATLQQWHARNVDRLDPDHREVLQLLPPTHETAQFELIDVPALPPMAGFAEEDIHEGSDDPDHDDFMDRLLANAGPVTVQTSSMATQAGAPPMRSAGPALGESEDEAEDDVIHYAKLDWEPERATSEPREDDVDQDLDDDEPPPWLTQVRASSRPTPEGASAQAALPPEVISTDTESDEAGDEASDEPDDEAVDEADNDPEAAEAEHEDHNADASEVDSHQNAARRTTLTDEAVPAHQPHEPAEPAQADPAQADTAPASSDPGAWLAAARAAINQRMSANTAESHLKMAQLAERMNAALADLQMLATTQPDPEWYTLLGMAYTIKGKVDAALAESQQPTDPPEAPPKP